MTLKLYNTLTRQEEAFTPADPKNVRMYVCGPTVYDKPHIGNARSVVVYDVLYRLLRHLYGESHVTYVRNITDVDDKINDAAKKNGETIQSLTARVTAGFHADMDALGCLRPTHEPRATDFVNASQKPSPLEGEGRVGVAERNAPKETMVAMIERLIANGHAYAAEGHVLFDVTSYKDYGALSGRTVEEQQAGARIAVEGYKRHPGDFVLWKPADAEDDPSSVFQSPWGPGRPGWHIECSVMSSNYLGADFDIHGGGADLMFPHHENEIAQSRCANPHSYFARYWVHNGFLTVNGEKMSKSLGNFITVRELLDAKVLGKVIRYVLLGAHYRKPLDFTTDKLDEAKHVLLMIWRQARKYESHALEGASQEAVNDRLNQILFSPLCSDLNFAIPLRELRQVAEAVKDASAPDHQINVAVLHSMLRLLGLNQTEEVTEQPAEGLSNDQQNLIDARIAAKQSKNWAEADRIRNELKSQGILLEDKPDGSTEWRRA
ncbi:MAG: cysteine--tRNA ligase [Alphaproteobacteria bacterium]|nr:cysteine--tRNA ligase [Alphaproteobacteria bacterium]